MSGFIISFNIFGEFDNFEDWDAAQEKEEKSGGVALADGVSPLSWDLKNPSRF